MAGADFRIDLQGEEQVERELAGLFKRLGDLSPLMDIIGQTLESDIEDNFDGQHAPDGTPWKPVKRREGDTRKILHGRQPRLRPSISRRVTAKSVEVGTNVVYARRHQEGFKGSEQVKSHKRILRQVFGVRLQSPREVMVGAFTRNANTPARPFLGMSPGARDDILGQIADYAQGDSQ